jgi:hypothetical protein
MTAAETPRVVNDMPARRPDEELNALLRGTIMISVGVPQGVIAREDDPTSSRTCLVRDRQRVSELTPEAFALWALLAVPRAPAEFAAAAAEVLAAGAIDQALAQLQAEGLVATFERGRTWEAASKRLRVIPTAYGVGNSAEDPSRYRIQAPRDNLTLSVDVCSFWNWLSWDGTATVYGSASDVAADLSLPLEVVLEYARSLLVSCLNAGFAFVEHAAAPGGEPV